MRKSREGLKSLVQGFPEMLAFGSHLEHSRRKTTGQATWRWESSRAAPDPVRGYPQRAKKVRKGRR